MALTGLQLIGMIALGVFGFQRGWRREIISLVGVLVGILFITLDGGRIVAIILFVAVPLFFQLITNRVQGVKSSTPAPPDPSPATVLVTSVIMFVLIVILGYIVSNKIGPKPAKPVDHILGIVPAVISGYLLTTYVLPTIPPFSSIPLLTNNWLKVDFNTPNLFSNSILFIFVITVVALVIGLMAIRTKKPSKK